MPSGIKTFPGFSKHARKLRTFYDEVYSSQDHPQRFSWDLWNVPDQYHLLRSPAAHFFPEKLIHPWMEELVVWGRKNLGCHTISPVWLSAYVEGCEQKFHIDRPHGPWAFVFSLCPKTLSFKGGNTLLLKDEILNYWNPQSSLGNFEMEGIFHSIKPKFNQLLIFDGRVPHGVERVTQCDEMKKARLVLHGWFLPPRPYVDGDHSPQALQSFLKDYLKRIGEENLFAQSAGGFLCLRFHASSQGKISKIEALPSTLRPLPGLEGRLKSDMKRALEVISEMNFPSLKKSGKGSWITLPIELSAS